MGARSIHCLQFTIFNHRIPAPQRCVLDCAVLTFLQHSYSLSRFFLVVELCNCHSKYPNILRFVIHTTLISRARMLCQKKLDVTGHWFDFHDEDVSYIDRFHSLHCSAKRTAPNVGWAKDNWQSKLQKILQAKGSKYLMNPSQCRYGRAHCTE